MIDDLFQSRIFHSTEAALFYIEGPSQGVPLILLHGITSRWQSFLPILPALTSKYHVFAVDFRGHGQSSRTPGAYRLKDYTRDIFQFIDQQVQETVVVYGHSLGALVGINLAAKHPEQIRALILGDPPLYYHDTLTQDTFWQQAFVELLELRTAHPDPDDMNSWLTQNYPGMPPERRAERVYSLAAVDPDVVRAVISNTQMEEISLPALVPGITCPVLLLKGNPNLGSALREQDVDFAVNNFPSVSVFEMETVGHGIIPIPCLPELFHFIDTSKIN